MTTLAAGVGTDLDPTLDPTIDPALEHSWELRLDEFEDGGHVRTFECGACGAVRFD